LERVKGSNPRDGAIVFLGYEHFEFKMFEGTPLFCNGVSVIRGKWLKLLFAVLRS